MTVKTKRDFYDSLQKVDFTRKQRARFARFMDENYNLNIQSFYRKLRRESLEQWELQGLLACAEEFDECLADNGKDKNPVTDIYQWFSQCDKMRFYDFMNAKGLCRDTIKKHMDDEDWTRLNLHGWNKAWDEFVEMKKQASING